MIDEFPTRSDRRDALEGTLALATPGTPAHARLADELAATDRQLLPEAPDVTLAEFRAALLVALPEAGETIIPATNPSGRRSDVLTDRDLYDQIEPDTDYNPSALAAWILAYVQHSYDAGAAAARAELEELIDGVSEYSVAAGVVSVAPSFAVYLQQVSAVLKRGLGIAEQWDLARTMGVEVARISDSLSGLLAKFPELAKPAENIPEESLVIPGQ